MLAKLLSELQRGERLVSLATRQIHWLIFPPEAWPIEAVTFITLTFPMARSWYLTNVFFKCTLLLSESSNIVDICAELSRTNQSIFAPTYNPIQVAASQFALSTRVKTHSPVHSCYQQV